MELLQDEAPEQLGIINHPVTAATDLFAVGCILYECLTGQPFFSSKSVSELISAQSEHNRSIEIQRADVPFVLNDLIQRLLEIDPEKRFGSAESLAHDLSKILDEIQAGQANPSVALGTTETS